MDWNLLDNSDLARAKRGFVFAAFVCIALTGLRDAKDLVFEFAGVSFAIDPQLLTISAAAAFLSTAVIYTLRGIEEIYAPGAEQHKEISDLESEVTDARKSIEAQLEKVIENKIQEDVLRDEYIEVEEEKRQEVENLFRGLLERAENTRVRIQEMKPLADEVYKVHSSLKSLARIVGDVIVPVGIFAFVSK